MDYSGYRKEVIDILVRRGVVSRGYLYGHFKQEGLSFDDIDRIIMDMKGEGILIEAPFKFLYTNTIHLPERRYGTILDYKLNPDYEISPAKH